MKPIAARPVPRRLSGALALLVLALFAAGCGGGASKQPEQQPPSVRDKLRMAQSMLNAGRVSDAVEVMNEALALEPENPQVHNFHGKLMFQAGRYAEAEAAFLKALELDPYLTDAKNFLGVVFAETGRLTEAEEAYDEALEDPAYPTPELIYLNLGLLHAGQGKDEEAIEALRRAVEIDPKFYKAHFELASLLDRNDRMEEAAREYEVAAPGFRNVGDYHYRLGLAYFRLGENDKARESLRRAIAVAPGSNSAAQADDLLRVME